eukprot:TRINITY_DN2609_c0_g1_i1.p1 TRINITY_DN2609_c0_g1~~TRINITY_DN2609_c0_g1_i1.p1  ORF type:complete len:386 (-),score=87.42 TRINITY_DN2609_c0_g1_i1:192-1349(-)
MGKKKDRQQKKRKAEQALVETDQPTPSSFTQSIQKTTRTILYCIFVAPILIILYPIYSPILWIKSKLRSKTGTTVESKDSAEAEDTEETKEEEIVEEIEYTEVVQVESTFDAEELENFKEEIRSQVAEFMEATNQKITGLEKQIASLKKQLKRAKLDSNSLTPAKENSTAALPIIKALPPPPPPPPLKPLFTIKPLVITKKGQNANTQASQSSGSAKPAINLSDILSKRSALRRSDSVLPVVASPVKNEGFSLSKLRSGSFPQNPTLTVTMSDLNSLSLKKVAIQRSPGGTPMRRDNVVQDVADTIPNMFSNALKRKFENARTPPRKSPLRNTNNSPNRTPKKSPKSDSVKKSGKENSMVQSSPLKMENISSNTGYVLSPVAPLR